VVEDIASASVAELRNVVKESHLRTQQNNLFLPGEINIERLQQVHGSNSGMLSKYRDSHS
jgi:hypothetical protein